MHIYRNPQKYSKNNALQYNFAMKVLSKISYKNTSRILDIGCGDGVITHELAKVVKKGCVIGTDISPQMIEFASKEYLNRPNLRFLQMDASKNIFREQFDIVTSFNCLHWVKEQSNALKGISKAAVSGAQILLLLSHKKSTYHYTLDQVCSNPKWKEYFVDYINPRLFFSPDEYKEMVISSGLEIIELSEEEMTYTFESKEKLKEFFRAAGSQLKQIPETKREEFLSEFASTYIAQNNCFQANLITVSFWCLQVIAAKPQYSLKKEVEDNYQPRIFSKL